MTAPITSRRSARLAAKQSSNPTTSSQSRSKAAKVSPAPVPSIQQRPWHGIQTASKASAFPPYRKLRTMQTARRTSWRPAYSPANSPKSPTDQRPVFPKTPFPLMSLPPEIRNMIYKFALPSAGAEFLAASRQIYQEAKGLVYQYGVLRITEDPASMADEVPPYRLTEAQLPLIQNFSLDLHLDLRPWADTVLRRADCQWSAIWEDYGMGFTNRKSCNITVYAKWKLEFYDIHYFCQGFKFLESFENLNITFKDKQMRKVRNPFKKAGPVRVYEDLLEAWQRRFGPAVWNDHEKVTERYLEFHPLEDPRESDGDEDDDEDW